MRHIIENKAFNEEQANDIYSLLETFEMEYTENFSGDVCVGDEIVFVEAVFTGSYKKPKFSHFNLIQGKVIKDSYGNSKQQHTFTIETGNGVILRKGRNVYRFGTFGKPRVNREKILEEKHERGKQARNEKRNRINSNFDSLNSFNYD